MTTQKRVAQKELLTILLMIFTLQVHAADTNVDIKHKSQPLLNKIGHRLSQIWNQGNPELYLTGLAWHNRFIYTPEKINEAHYNEFAAGGGFGKGFIDEDGDWHALYAMGFSDSHRNFQPLAGYGFLKMRHFPHKFNLGAGFTWFATAREDIFHGIPFIGIPLPMIGLGADKLTFFATYVPGKQNIGNVLFAFVKWQL